MKYIFLDKDDDKAIKRMSDLASGIVREHYDPIVGEVQNSYMINMFQSEGAIKEQLRHGYLYYFVTDDEGNDAGFLAFYPKEDEMYISKFYLRKSMRGKGISKDMLKFVIGKTRECGFNSISLNVNKRNDAIAAYEKLGFKQVGKEKNDIGCGYYMDDFVYRYNIEN